MSGRYESAHHAHRGRRPTAILVAGALGLAGALGAATASADAAMAADPEVLAVDLANTTGPFRGGWGCCTIP